MRYWSQLRDRSAAAVGRVTSRFRGFREHAADGAVRASADQVEPEAVRWGYRLFLDREPEDEAVLLRTAAEAKTWRGLHDHFTSSAEYAAVHSGNVRPSLTGLEPAIRVDAADAADDIDRLLRHVQSSWTALGATEPHYSVLTDGKFRPDSIDHHLDEFYASGEGDVRRLSAILVRNSLPIDVTMSCLELGCGVGRDTMWLASSFRRVIAIDVSANHLSMAADHLREHHVTNVHLVLLRDFAVFAENAPYDCFFSQIVLQHNPPPVIEKLLDAAFGGLAPGGVAVFQVPTYRADYSFDLEAYLHDTLGVNDMEMHVLPQRRIFALAERHGLDVVEVIEDGFTGMRPGELSNTFVLRKRPAG